MKIKKSVLLTLAALSAPAWAQTCQPSATTPFLNINGTTSWVVQASASLNTPGSSTTTPPSCSSRRQACVYFVMRIR